MIIDPHVHCRDGPQSKKETIAHALSVAERAGFSAIFDMPNTDPPIMTRELAIERIKLAKKTDSPVWYGLYMGLTSDKKQIADAVAAHRDIPEIVGFKLYAGHSTGNLGVTQEVDQQRIFYELARNKYQGVVAVHCEKESLMRPDIWDPRMPITHAIARHPDAEVKSLEDQIDFALYAGFEGTMHIAHISVPESVDLVEQNRSRMKITCGVCPHHLVLNMGYLLRPDGLIYKMNPPLRPEEMRKELEDQAKGGFIDCFESDHAPHLLEEKEGEPYASGVPGIQYYPHFMTWLTNHHFGRGRIKDMRFNNIKKIFGDKAKHIQPRDCDPDFDLAKEYEYDPFKDVKN